tara:strand:+ start:307 stop:537 length:231 start_codon:yes stop_codon:yes gene_type:complete
MHFLLRKIFFALTFNFSLFMILMIGIQNSSNQKKVNLLVNETINLPISFISGVSFISGSLTGSFLKIFFNTDKEIL